MSNLSDIDINKVCRTCLSAVEDMKSLYEANLTSKQICLAELLMFCTPLKFSENDGYPTTICHNCIRDLNQCYTFRLKCLESNEWLHNHLERMVGIATTKSYSENKTTKSLSKLSEIRKDNQELDLIQNVINVKMEMENDKINSSLVNPHKITDVFNNLLNKTKCESATELLDQNLDLVGVENIFEEVTIKCEPSLNLEDIEEVSVKSEYPINLENRIIEGNITKKSLKNPLTTAEIQKDINQVLDIVKHEVDTKNEEASANKQEKEKPYSCTMCNKSYRSKQSLKIHMVMHTGEKPYPCTVCNHSFKTKQCLTYHIRKHTEEKSYSCTVCHLSFTSNRYLTYHIRTHSEKATSVDNQEKPYSCTICNKSYKLKQNLKIHMRWHTEATKPYACQVCDRAFYTKQHLKYHMRSHTGEKPYSCTVCERSFYTKQHLTDHMRSHTGEKPYSCTVCDRAFYTKQHLTYHLGTHTAEKPYTCTVCGNLFASKQNLLRHMRIHTGEKPYSCTVCDSAFYTKQHLITHKRTHKREKT